MPSASSPRSRLIVALLVSVTLLVLGSVDLASTHQSELPYPGGLTTEGHVISQTLGTHLSCSALLGYTVGEKTYTIGADGCPAVGTPQQVSYLPAHPGDGRALGSAHETRGALTLLAGLAGVVAFLVQWRRGRKALEPVSGETH